MKKTKQELTIIVTHIVSWLVFLSLPAVFNPRRHGVSISNFVNDLLEPPRWTNALLLVVLFYTNYYVTIPLLYIRRRFFYFGCSFIAWLTVFAMLNYSMMPPEIKYAVGKGGFDALGNSFNLFMFIIVYSLSFTLCLYEQWQSAKERTLRTEISFLKAQINPHFLFNALNSIYSLALTKSDNAPDAILKLSDMMRYSVSDGNQNLVSLSKELAYIDGYIALQKLRLPEKVGMRFDVTGTTDGKHIAPFLLIPFVENAFRYGVNSEENSDIRIRIEITERLLNLTVSNNKVFSRQEPDNGSRLGISNTRTRLQLLYPGKHVLTIKEDNDEFSVLLQIQIT